MERYLNLSLPFGLVPTEATIGSYRQKPSARALHRVYSVEATFGSEKRCFHRYETGGERWPVSARLVATNYRPTGIKPVVANRRKKCFTASPTRGEGEKTRWDLKSIGISSLSCDEMCAKMRLSPFGTQFVSLEDSYRCA